MKVDISGIVKVDGASLDIEFDKFMENLKFENSSVKFDKPVKLKGRLINASGIINLNGRLKAEYEVECSRCLKSLRRMLEIKLNEDFVSIGNEVDDDVYVYENNQIDLDKVVADNVLLSLPVRQLCNDSCKGFCPKCGTNLNEGTCDCKDEKINPQMEKLKGFFRQ